MPSIEKGAIVGIPCKVSGGVLPGELGVTVDTTTGPVSGFVTEDSLKRTPDVTYILGIVLDADKDRVCCTTSRVIFYYKRHCVFFTFGGQTIGTCMTLSSQ